MPRVLIVRGHLVTPWELRPWLELPDRFEVRCLLTRSNRFAPPDGLRYVDVRSLRDFLPRGLIGETATGVLGDRYVSADEAFAWADIVHSEELSFWFSADAARRRHRFALVQTIWETLPLLASYRNRHARRNRELVLRQTDLFLPTTERAALALRLEGVPDRQIRVCSPGIDLERFQAPPRPPPPDEHLIVSPGRLVWEKGHQDVLRALALLHRGVVKPNGSAPVCLKLLIVGAGPEEARLRRYTRELGLGGVAEIRGFPYDEMPGLFGSASAMVLASLPAATAALHPFDIPHAFWEEQFGMVLAEAMASGLAIVTTTSGAVPEVVAGTPAELVASGDWVAIARALAEGPLQREPGARVAYDRGVVERYSTTSAAERLAVAYDALLAGTAAAA